MGEILWREAPVEADLVISVPDSGNPAAGGFARASGIPQDDGLIKNRYVARTFIQPGQELRKRGLRMKFNPLPEIVSGKRVVVVDDSIVRGNTTRQIVAMLKDAGAKEVHLRISAPPIRHPCHYGIDMSTREEMIAHGRTVEEIAAELGADSLAYLSLEGVYEAIGTPAESHCDACFTGNYPLGDGGEGNGKFALEELASPPALRWPVADERHACVEQQRRARPAALRGLEQRRCRRRDRRVRAGRRVARASAASRARPICRTRPGGALDGPVSRGLGAAGGAAGRTARRRGQRGRARPHDRAGAGVAASRCRAAWMST